MSYRNPQVYFADTQAFSKGFEDSFGKFQQKFEEDRLEKERIRQENEESLSKAFKESDVSGIAGIDAKIMDGIQSSIDSILVDGRFSSASESEKAKMLRKVSYVKNTVSRLGELAEIDYKDWDMRNSPKLGALKAAMTRGDKSINIEGDGLDLKITGDFGEVSLDELASAKFMKRSDYEVDYKDLNSAFRTKADSIFKEAAKLGLSIEDIEQKLKEQFVFMLKNEDSPELWSYLYSNEISPATQKEGGSMYYNDPDIISGLKSIEEKDAFPDKQFTLMANELAQKAIGSVYNYSDFAAAYKLKAEQERSMEWAKIKAQSSQTKAPPKLTPQQVNAFTAGKQAIEGSKALEATPTLRDNWKEMLESAKTGNVAAITGTPLALIMISAGYSLEGDVPNGYRFTKKGSPNIELRTDLNEDNIRKQLEAAFTAEKNKNENLLIGSGKSIYKDYDPEGNEINTSTSNTVTTSSGKTYS